MKVLVIDDEAMIRDLATKVLSRAGVEVLAAESGQAGIDIFGQHAREISVVLLDVSMPGLSGMDTLRALRQLSTSVPCILSSGMGMEADEVPEDLRANLHFLQKPYRSQILVAKVKEAAASVGVQN